MVTVFLRGGLGNQMFQYALGLHLAKKNNAGLFLDTVFLNDRFPRKEFAYRTYDLGVFRQEARFTLLSRISTALPVPGLWLALDIAFMKAMGVLGVCRIIKEKDEYAFDPAVLHAAGNIVLWGRWQNEKYFADVAGEVARAFRPRDEFTGDAARIAQEIRETNSVSLHVRRGDYAAFKSVEQLHGKTDLGYYGRAVSYIAGHVSRPHFFVFSDDIAWCRENLKIGFPATFVGPSAAGPNDAFHLGLMSLCKHNIIANSTFSWWGAWLNENTGKIIVAPKKWMPSSAGEEDVIPVGWVKL